MRARSIPVALLAASALLLLSACSFSTTVTSPAGKVASTAESALEKKVGSRPDIDCGDKPITIVKGKTITCDLTDPGDGSVYDVKITFTSVQGTKYHIDVKVADTPKTGPTDAPSDGGPSATVPQADFAALAAKALAPKLGFTPAITCADDPVTIKVDA
ncbi:MAG TPA: DUF4333 domain-containing protein, partial [Pseudolysinimonas sp.]|nr:DUF4333 domain-containing protein [Pseudolysinimonas sp.]